jgi:branched-chain amino acid transport system permease protein
MSIGLALIFGVMFVINFAHGAFLMLAMYTSFMLFHYFHVDPYLSICIVIPLFFVLGFATQKLLIQPIADAPHVMQLLMTFGLSIALENTALLLWGGDYRSMRVSYGANVIELGGVLINVIRLIACIISVSLAIALFVLLKKTRIGKAIRAASQQRSGAILMGVNVKRISQITFGVGAACVGVTGAILTPIYSTFPSIGTSFVFISFLVVIMAGGKNLIGVFVCGLIVGLIEAFSGYFFAPALKGTVCFIIFILIQVPM